MSRKSSNRVNFSPDIYESPAILIKRKHHKNNNNNLINNSYNNNWPVCCRVRENYQQQSRPLRFLRRLGDKTVRVLRFIGTAGKKTLSSRSCNNNKVVSNSSPTATMTGGNNLMRSRSLVDQSESHRAQAIEDCIEFLHSYSSLQRSSSVSSSVC